MSDKDDILHLVEDTVADKPPVMGRPWKVAIIDDDPAVHEGTKFALYDYSLNGQGIEILSAHSAEEGRELMRTLRTRKDQYLAERLRKLSAEDRETLDRAADLLERLLEEDPA